MFFVNEKTWSFKHTLSVLLYIVLTLLATLLASTSIQAKTAADMTAHEIAQS